MTDISVIFGTRPEAIKLAPLILEMQRRNGLRLHVCVTAQHREMLDQVLDVFGIVPDVDLGLMESNQSLACLTARAIAGIDEYLSERQPDVVIVQGDTTTVFCAALAAFYHHIPLGHVEAGLRTGNMQAPWPEEANRVLTSRLTEWHFAPTESSRRNLLAEGVDEQRVFVTGNTVIDALHIALEKTHENPPRIPGDECRIRQILDGRRLVLVTAHRRENFGERLESICRAIRRLAERHRDVAFVYPVHLNPRARKPALTHLSDLDNVVLTDPLDYLPFVYLLGRATLVLTDSGGLQEEAPSLGKPVLVMRDVTERPEGLEAGTARLVGAEQANIVRAVSRLLTDEDEYARMANAVNPYGDGSAAGRVCDILEREVSA